MSQILTTVFAVWIALAARADWRTRRVSNRMLAWGLAGGVVALALGAQFPQFRPFNASVSDSLIGFFAGLGLMLPAFALRTAGASDVKFFAILGIWTGASILISTWIIASLLAAAHALIAISRRNQALREAARAAAAGSNGAGPTLATRSHLRGIPYVTYLAGGAAFALFLDMALNVSLDLTKASGAL